MQLPARRVLSINPGKRDPRFHLYFTQPQAQVSQRRRRSVANQQEGRNLRAAVEATAREVKNSFPAGKLPVRGRFRMACMMIGSASLTNVRRIQRHLAAKRKQESKKLDTGKVGGNIQESGVASFGA
jgi:hypothetical protein